MPIPIPPPNEVELRPAHQPYYIREKQNWQIEEERERHVQALYMVGEWTMFILMWHQADFDAGLVQRCSRCYSTAGSKQRQIADVYNQPIQNKCENCYGTTFEGGYRARIVRPAIFSDADEDERQDRKGSMHPAQASIESTPDFRVREGDFAFRKDGSRWRLSTMQRVQLRTGFEHPSQSEESITYNNSPAKLEDKTSVAYMIPPAVPGQLRLVLDQPLRRPGDFRLFEEVRGALIPETEVLS
jgi:hypothetical protein